MRVVSPSFVRRVEELRSQLPRDQHAVEFWTADGDDRAGHAGRRRVGDHPQSGRDEFVLDDPDEGFEAVQPGEFVRGHA
ncbi:hypothetical protein [Amycolatopsis sp. NPDC003676]